MHGLFHLGLDVLESLLIVSLIGDNDRNKFPPIGNSDAYDIVAAVSHQHDDVILWPWQ